MTDEQKDLLWEMRKDLRGRIAGSPPKSQAIYQFLERIDAIEAALKEVEALEKLIQWAKDRVHHESDGKDFYYRGVGAACRAILDRIPEDLNDEQIA